MSQRKFLAFVSLALVVLLSVTMLSRMSYAQRANVFDKVHDTTGIGRSHLQERFQFSETELTFFPIEADPNDPFPALGEDSWLGLLAVKIENVTDDPMHLNPNEHLMLLDDQGRTYMPQFLHFDEGAQQIMATEAEVSITLFNPHTPQYRYLVFILPADATDFELVSTDYSVRQGLTIETTPTSNAE